MADVTHAAADAHCALQRFAAVLASHSEHAALAKSVSALVTEVESQFEVKQKYNSAARRQDSRKSNKQLLNSMKNLRRKLSKMATARKQLQGKKTGNQLAPSVIVRAMLAEATLPSRTVRDMINEHNFEENNVIGHVSIGRIRDAFVERLKSLNRQGIGRAYGETCKSLGNGPLMVCLSHVHDGADLRMRSYARTLETCSDLFMPQDAPRLSRQKSSKIQNHVLQVCGLSADSIPVFTELQPLAKKDKISVASSIITAVSAALDSMFHGTGEGAQKPKVIHCVTGDAVNTNEAALRVCMHFFQQQSKHKTAMRYRLICWRCAAHKGNLVTMTAMHGRFWS